MITKHLTLFSDTLPLHYLEGGEGRPYLLLHGGAGPHSIGAFSELLARTSRVIMPTHPGFEGQPRPEWFRRIDDLVLAYLTLIEKLALPDVIIIGNSVGGWIAAELALRASPAVAAVVILDGVGMEPNAESGEIANPAELGPRTIDFSFHDPQRFGSALLGPEGSEGIIANQPALLAYAGNPYMHDPELRSRLKQVAIPTLVLWGESDRIVTPAYGQQFANSIPDATFSIIAKAGHFPQIEQADAVLDKIEKFSHAL